MKDTPGALTELPAKLTGSFVRHFLKDRYRKTLHKLCRGKKELPEGTARARVVIFHGYTKHMDTPDMQRFRHTLVTKGRCDVFYCDLPYHGLSVPEGKEHLRGKIKFFSRLVEAVYAHTLLALSEPYPKPIPVILVGYSLGGLALIRFLEEHLELQKYIALAVFVATPLRVDHNADALIRRYKPYIEKAARFASYIPYIADIPVGDLGIGDAEDDLEYNKKIDLRSAIEVYTTTVEARKDLPKITLPCAFLHGTSDAIAPVREVEEAYKRIGTPSEKKRIILFPDAPHQILDEFRSRTDTAKEILGVINEAVDRKDWVPLEYEALADDVMELTSDTYSFLRRRLQQLKKILLRWLQKLTFWQ